MCGVGRDGWGWFVTEVPGECVRCQERYLWRVVVSSADTEFSFLQLWRHPISCNFEGQRVYRSFCGLERIGLKEIYGC